MAINIGQGEHEAWCQLNPAAFTVPDHYKNYDYMVIHLQAATEADIRALIKNAWHRRGGRNA